jgi:hypothetical protein
MKRLGGVTRLALAASVAMAAVGVPAISGSAGAATTPTAPAAATTCASPKATTLYSDAFTGANGAPWSKSWLTANRNQRNGTVTIQGNLGRLAVNGANRPAAGAQLTGVAARANTGVKFSYQWASNASVGSRHIPATYLSVFLQGSWFINMYRPASQGIELNSSQSIAFAFNHTAAGAVKTIATVTNAQAVTTARQWVHVRLIGTTLQFHTWRDGASEPTTWHSVNVTAGAKGLRTPTTGQLFLSVVNDGAYRGANAVTIDNLTYEGLTC